MQSEIPASDREHGSGSDTSGRRTFLTTRRAVVGAAAWGVPAIIATAATPAVAASRVPTIVLTVPPTAIVRERVTVSAVLTSVDGSPMAGESITFLVNPVSVGVFAPAASSVTTTTDASGVAIVGILDIKSAGTLTVVATAAGTSDTRTIFIEESTGTIAFDQDRYDVQSNSVNEVIGRVTLLTGTVRPSALLLTYTGDVTGPGSVVVAGAGAFRITGIQVGPGGGTITASANRFGQSVVTFVVVP
jgi:hypothetical protein